MTTLLLQRARRAFLGKFAGLLAALGRQAVLVLVEVFDRHDFGERFRVAIAIGLQLADRHRLVGGILDLILEAVRRQQSVWCARGVPKKDYSMSMVMPLSFHMQSDAMKPS